MHSFVAEDRNISVGKMPKVNKPVFSSQPKAYVGNLTSKGKMAGKDLPLPSLEESPVY